MESNKQRLYELGNIIKEKRESLGFPRSELAVKTKVSVTIIQALENGWFSQLPKTKYLPKMIIRLGKELGIETSVLNDLLADEISNSKEKNMPFFTPSSIDIFTTWQGSLFYLIAILISFLLINKYHTYLSENQAHTNIPIILE
ncbi:MULTISPECIES: helix-turn-helix domain-containing protein [Prochlorococcus]|uniref:helix-turn-helix domain-containing protein n=1 Tax=Prochlorococcus TaxID=1218 RepID=UPI0005339845|nr:MULTISPECIES: helix-turn-helix domain-containing protein [Prochlorococcus]KGG12243.1 hypothetical protein EV05_1452 [Prochlorococcus sp. MIT 0601]